MDLQLEVAYNSAAPPPSACKGNGSTCISAVELWAGGKGVPHIFTEKGGRGEQGFVVDRKLQSASSVSELLRTVTQWLQRFDAGNAVVALAQAAKVAEDSQSERALKANLGRTGWGHGGGGGKPEVGSGWTATGGGPVRRARAARLAARARAARVQAFGVSGGSVAGVLYRRSIGVAQGSFGVARSRSGLGFWR